MSQHTFAPIQWVKREAKLFSTLVRSVPILVIVLFSLSVISMNFLASYTIVNTPYIALNAGIFVSWVTFLLLDIITKRFGPKAANRISWIGLGANLVAVGIFFLISQIGTIPDLDMVLHGQWSILLASTIAFIVSTLVNNSLNSLIGRAFAKNPNGKAAFFCRSYVSTLVGQVVDNFLFAMLAFIIFPMIPGALPVTWTWTQVAVCSATFALAELGMEILFSPIGYRVSLRWRRNGVGQEYIDAYYPQPSEGQ